MCGIPRYDGDAAYGQPTVVNHHFEGVALALFKLDSCRSTHNRSAIEAERHGQRGLLAGGQHIELITETRCADIGTGVGLCDIGRVDGAQRAVGGIERTAQSI